MIKLARKLLGLETRSLRPETMPWLGDGAATASGVTVSIDVALRVPAVAAAVRAIAEAAMTLPARVVRVGVGAAAEDREHPVSRLIADGVNDWTDWPTFVRDLTIDALCRDAGGLAWVNRPAGEVREVIAYRPGIITVEYAETGEPTYRLAGRVLDGRDIVHLAPPFGRAPLSLAREAIGLAAMMEHHGARLFGNGRSRAAS